MLRLAWASLAFGAFALVVARHAHGMAREATAHSANAITLPALRLEIDETMLFDWDSWGKFDPRDRLAAAGPERIRLAAHV
jgi:hypothetical protein